MSETQICNIALTRLGASTITSLDDATQSARVCKTMYGPTRDALLREHPWNFAIKRVALAQSTTTPAFEFSYQYSLPADCLRVIKLSEESYSSGDPEYRVEGGFLLTNEGTVKIEYVAQITDTDLFDAQFSDCLSSRLAKEIAMTLTDNAQIAEQAAREYERKLSMARGMDAREGTPRAIVADAWTMSRL